MIDVKKVIPGCVLRHRHHIGKPFVYVFKGEKEDDDEFIPDPKSHFLVLKVEWTLDHQDWPDGMLMVTVLVEGIVGTCAVTNPNRIDFGYEVVE